MSVFWIADASSNHCNDLQTAKDLIYAAKESGASSVKWQYWNTDKFINKARFEKLKLAHQKKWKKSVYEVYKEYQLDLDWIPILYDECKKNDIDFSISCYDIDMIDELDKYVTFWKVGSGDIDYIPMLEKLASKNKPVFLGCGASHEKEMLFAKNILSKEFDVLDGKFLCRSKEFLLDLNKVILFKCNTNYSANDNKNFKHLNLWSIVQYDKDDKRDFVFFEGLSDHTKSIIPIISSISLGVRYIERHFKLKDNNSPDNSFSLNPKEWRNMVNIGEQTLISLGDGKIKIMENELESRVVQRRSKDDWKRPDIEWYNNNLKDKL